jgi:serine/threonine protein kinase
MPDTDTPELLVARQDHLEEGTTVAGRYRVVHSLGQGGFAQVYLATHLEVDSLKVAVKVLHPSQATPETLDRFRNEAKLLAMLRNRHTVKLTDFGVSDEGIAYLVMEYVEGTPLDRVIAARGAMRDPDVCRLGIGILKALIEAHSVGVIHRDLKPANIVLVTEPGEKHVVPRVLDFGIAKVLGGASPVEDHIVNEDGSYEPVVYCTPAYAAPELLRGRPEFQTDLYALGLVMIEMLEGATPYDYVDEDPAASPHLWSTQVPLGLRAKASVAVDVIRRSVAKELSDRYPSASAMLADLEHAYEELRTRAREPELTKDYFKVATAPPVKLVSQTAMFVQTAAVGVENLTGMRAVATAKRSGSEPEGVPNGRAPISGEQWTPPELDRDRNQGRAVHVDPASPGPVFTPPSSAVPPPRLSGGPVASSRSGSDGHVRPAIPRQTEASRIDNVVLFGQELMSGRVTWAGVVVVLLAVALPAIVAVWSFIRYANNN